VYGIVRLRTFVNKFRAFREQIIGQGWVSGRGFLLSPDRLLSLVSKGEDREEGRGVEEAQQGSLVANQHEAHRQTQPEEGGLRSPLLAADWGCRR
jgi:hypothetical protein